MTKIRCLGGKRLWFGNECGVDPEDGNPEVLAERSTKPQGSNTWLSHDVLIVRDIGGVPSDQSGGVLRKANIFFFFFSFLD